MRLSIRSSPAALLIGLILSSHAAIGQSLSIKRVDNKYWIEASAPAGDPHTLQASDNLHLWVDIRADVQEPYSFALDAGGVSERYFRLAPSVPPAPPIRVMVIGDSMSSDCCGWGGGLYPYFKENAAVINYAQPWTSSKVFLQSAELDKMLLVKPDYVLMQFAYSDGGADEFVRGTTQEEFTENLRTIVQTIRGFNGIPIMITLHASRTWDDQGHLIPSDHPYNLRTKQVAAELNAPLIDLYPITRALYDELGPTGSAFMHWTPGGASDDLHTSPLGAVYISRVLTHYLPDSFGPYLTGIFDPPPSP